MKFSKDSEFFLKFLIDKFDKFNKKGILKNNDEVFKMLFNDINLSYNYIKYLNRNDKIEKKILSSKDLNYSHLILSSFVPNKIRKIIKNEIGQILQYNVEFPNHEVQVNFIIYDKNEDIAKYDLYSNLVFSWLKMAFMYSRANCSKKLKIFIYMLEEKKYLPEKPVEILSPDHCNSAVTTACQSKTEIIIYRKEEWFKVLIHESFHSLGLDFANY